jgi:hypothetical protein
MKGERMGNFMKKLEKFFSEEENYLPGAEPVDFQGARYIPYTAREDKDSVWPNIYCSSCGHLELKKKMFFSPERGSFIHPSCMSEKDMGKTTSRQDKEKKLRRKKKGGKSPTS